MKNNTKFWALGLSMFAAACSGSEKPPEAQNNQAAANEQVAAANVSAAASDSSATNASMPDATRAKEAEKPVDAAPEDNKVAAKIAPKIAAASTAPEPVKVEVAPPASFARCVVCHDAHKSGEDKLGPNLYGVFGAKAGKHRPGFNYSEALKNSGLVWTEANLDKWLTKPMEMVPGTYMSFPGIKNPAQRQELIDYLKSLK